MFELYEVMKTSWMKCWPGLFLDEWDVLDHMFFTEGNGLYWNQGGLTDSMSEEARFQLAFSVMSPEERITPFEEIKTKERRYRREFTQENGDGPFFFLPDGETLGIVVTLSQEAQIMHLPDDIQPDWLDAAKRAVAFAESDRGRVSKGSERYLRLAKWRLKELSEKISAFSFDS